MPVRSTLRSPAERTGLALGRGVGGSQVGATSGAGEERVLGPRCGCTSRHWPPQVGWWRGKEERRPGVRWEAGRAPPATNLAPSCPPKARTQVSTRPPAAQPIRSRLSGVLQWARVGDSPPRPALYKQAPPLASRGVYCCRAGVGPCCGVHHSELASPLGKPAALFLRLAVIPVLI